MKKILIIILTLLPLLTGCSSWEDFSLVHSPDIEQGNIITPEMVALLEPGMSKRQVRFALGSPMLIDVFHQQRWDYLFSVKRRNEPMEIKRYSLYFDGDRLARFGGEIEPATDIDSSQEKKELLVSVPDYDGDLGILERLWYSLGFGKDD
ncbi:outer membrane protein assembly factor BamE [Candidatus Thiodiazotropha sp. CDECU1]|uniref:outer membrane protein assembly factor BamE n=1 Tax=Candidatus Thiodiazotropha sp. CDECU1 TaxID=3065865 RepID=UPI00292D2849|nr:outer membrane protein assembly factor BamE [Candidatus Thiodiazotropha sp. CDECU1]